jgi:hypothetical protein
MMLNRSSGEIGTYGWTEYFVHVHYRPSLAFPDSYYVARWRFCAQQVDYTDTVKDQERH